MGGTDTPWGAEEIELNTAFSLAASQGDLVLKKLQIDAEELTPVEVSRRTNSILYVTEGMIDLKVGDEFYELEAGDAHFIEAGTEHQLENLDDSVTTVLKISFPYDPDDIEVLDDPYA